MDNKIIEANNEIRRIKAKLQVGDITYADAKAYLKPYIDTLNEKGREVARRFKKPYHEITFSGLMR